MKNNFAVICLALALGFAAGHFSSPSPAKAAEKPHQAQAYVQEINGRGVLPLEGGSTVVGFSCLPPSSSAQTDMLCYVISQ